MTWAARCACGKPLDGLGVCFPYRVFHRLRGEPHLSYLPAICSADCPARRRELENVNDPCRFTRGAYPSLREMFEFERLWGFSWQPPPPFRLRGEWNLASWY